MEAHLNKLHNYMVSLSTTRLIVIMAVAQVIIRVPLIPILFLIGTNNEPDLREFHEPTGFVTMILLMLIIAPLMETIVYQWGVIKIIHGFLDYSKGVSILMSAVLYSLSHNYNIWYMLNTFVLGLIYAYTFSLCEYERKSNSIFIVSVIHLMNNLLYILVSVYAA